DPGHVGERAVAVVAEEDLALPAVEAVLAEIEKAARALLRASTDALEHVHSDVVEERPGDEPVGHEEIGPAVVVVVDRFGGPGPLRIAYAGSLAHVGEVSVPVVAVERAAAHEVVDDLVGALADAIGEEAEEPVRPRDRRRKVGMEERPAG